MARKWIAAAALSMLCLISAVTLIAPLSYAGSARLGDTRMPR